MEMQSRRDQDAVRRPYMEVETRSTDQDNSALLSHILGIIVQQKLVRMGSQP